ncbi:hypothetical protein BACPLE_00995 [Phocaeicola plebeius DSM 17135]|uniref:Uncharacterized protein n=1 Tax=Phocaeicola plebeius (strain DSM 17135 / JCM 12973 / CCUG 54634 / M2) TaxID=484018 RepID=B5CWA5_PHOPM|nr:hypothetical protein [Phocaeicola plebeius]EDY96552.1 hypothetical protein BACPLE_00995 [Phocaeicola plebeius DSM 17135]
MKHFFKQSFISTAFLSLLFVSCGTADVHKTEVSIVGEEFYINGKPTFEGKTWRGMKIQGLLPNARLVNGILMTRRILRVINGRIRIRKYGMPTAIQESL